MFKTLISVDQLQKKINFVAVNYKGSIVEEFSVDAITVDQLLILVSHLRIFDPIMFRRVSDEVVVMWKVFKASFRFVFQIQQINVFKDKTFH